MRGVGHRHERAVRCGGRETCARRARVTRTAKSCGPDAAVLASSCVVAHRSFGSSAISMRRRWQKSRSPGRARSKPYSHCAGKAGVFPLNLYARVRLCLRTLHTRPRVQRAPGLPCALCSQGGASRCKPRAQRVARSQNCIQPSLPATNAKRLRKGAKRRSNPSVPRVALWIASRSLSSGAPTRDPVARNDG